MMSPTGDKPGWAGDEIFASLRSFVRMTSFGRAVSDNKGFLAHLPTRDYFSPDASDPLMPKIYRRGEMAELAVPGWAMPVDNLFE